MEIGQQFADCRVDRSLLKIAAVFVHPRCVYVNGNTVLIGRDRILPMLSIESMTIIQKEPIENAVRLSFPAHDELLVIENGLIVKIEVLTAQL